jgi:hypothetical protein
MPQSVILKDDVAFLVGVNLLAGHLYGDFRANQEDEV